MSQKLEAYIHEYVMLHKKGNPQMMLESYGEKKKVGFCVHVEKERGNQFYCGLKEYWMLKSECAKCEKKS